MSISSNFPALKPSLLLDFANVKALDPRITFTRTTTATYFDANGVMQTAPAGVARFDHNPTTGESLGLLVEEQRTNLLTYSEEFDDAAWGKTASSITANTIVGPDGALTGDKLVENTANASHFISRNVTVTAAATLIYSVYAKAGERSVFNLRITDGVIGFARKFDVSNGTSDTEDVASTSPATVYGMESVGNGWWRCYVGCTMVSGTTSNLQFRLNNSGDSYTGDGTSGIYIWGAQLEAGAFPTSYIPTVAASVTRNADAASMTGTNFSSWYRADEGTLYVDWIAGQDDIFINPLSGGGGANTGSFAFRRGSSGNFTWAVVDTTTVQANITLITGSPVSGTNYKTIGCYKVDDFAATINGATPVTDTSGTVPSTIETLIIGNGYNNNTGASANEYLNSHVKKISFYPSRLSDAQLQALTA